MNHLRTQHLTKIFLTGLALLSASILLGGCSTENFTRAGYEAARQYQCNEQILDSDCRENYPSFEEYQYEKSKISE